MKLISFHNNSSSNAFVFYHSKIILQGSHSIPCMFKTSWIWCKVAAIKPTSSQPLLVFLSFLSTSWNVKFGEPMLQLVPDVGCARGNTIIQWKSCIPGRTAAEQFFITLIEFLDWYGVLLHRSAALTKYQVEISCSPRQSLLYRTEVSPDWGN